MLYEPRLQHICFPFCLEKFRYSQQDVMVMFTFFGCINALCLALKTINKKDSLWPKSQISFELGFAW